MIAVLRNEGYRQWHHHLALISVWMEWTKSSAFFPINSSRLEKIVTPDIWSNEKAKREFGWQPMDVFENYKILK
jgi:hypothetical protein